MPDEKVVKRKSFKSSAIMNQYMKDYFLDLSRRNVKYGNVPSE